MSNREKHEDTLQAQLDGWNTELENLKEKAKLAEINLQLEYYTLIDELKLELEQANRKLEVLKGSSDEKWEALKTDIKITWDSVEDLIKSITLP
ncbi:MAG: coiled coil domain-containing protein [Gammaproteobacteria bacterium]|nr:MAG: coiled coil domain-containing protein [Gammaproteobacteria bacterium]